MELSLNAAVETHVAQTQQQLRSQVEVAVMKKALEAEGQAAIQLLQAIPAPPPVPQGSLGQHIDVMA